MSSKRTISALNEAATLESNVKLVILARLDFSSGVKRFHTEIGPRTAVHPVYGSETYAGIGDFGGINGEVKESISGAPVSITIGLTGVDSTLINTALTDNYFRRDAEIMVGFEDAAGDWIDDPEILFSGYMDKIDMSMQDHSAGLSLSLESRGTNLLTSSDWRVTDEDLQAESTNDLLFEYVYQMVDAVIKWGGENVGGSWGGSSPRFKYPDSPR